MNTPRTDALLEDIESCADAIDWAEFYFHLYTSFIVVLII